MPAVTLRRGRILGLGVRPVPNLADRPRTLTFLALLLTLPFFGQSFHYVVDLPPTYYLSKAWPIVTLPLAIYALVTVRLPWAWLYGALIAYVLGLTPLLSMIYLGNGLIDALSTTAKSLPFLYYFAAAGLLALLQPSQDQVRRAIVGLGIGTFLLMGFLWLVVPAGFYRIDAAQSKLFLYETERGYRIFMPMFFGILTIFYLARRLMMRRDLLAGLGVLIGFALLVLIFKQRTVILAVALTIGWIAFRCSRGWVRALLLAGGVTVAIAVGILILGPMLARLEAALGASLSIRQASIGLAADYIQGHPLVLMFGAGSITRLSQNTLSTLLGYAHFYLADIGWLGIVFEYGLTGAALIVRGLCRDPAPGSGHPAARRTAGARDGRLRRLPVAHLGRAVAGVHARRGGAADGPAGLLAKGDAAGWRESQFRITSLTRRNLGDIMAKSIRDLAIALFFIVLSAVLVVGGIGYYQIGLPAYKAAKEAEARAIGDVLALVRDATRPICCRRGPAGRTHGLARAPGPNRPAPSSKMSASWFPRGFWKNRACLPRRSPMIWRGNRSPTSRPAIRHGWPSCWKPSTTRCCGRSVDGGLKQGRTPSLPCPSSIRPYNPRRHKGWRRWCRPPRGWPDGRPPRQSRWRRRSGRRRASRAGLPPCRCRPGSCRYRSARDEPGWR
jgi:hypothetical protein